MLWRYEFEICTVGERGYAVPFDFDGVITLGLDDRDACEACETWIYDEIRQRALRHEEMPDPSKGNYCKRGGKVIAVYADSSSYDVMTGRVRAVEAAKMLGVSSCRVTQMVKTRQLEGFKEGRKTWISLESVRSRMQNNPGPGRPRKYLVEQ